MLAFCARRLGSTARGSARGVATRTGSGGPPSLLRQHAKPVAFAGLACAASFAAADTCIRYRRGNEAAFGKWNRILDPPEQMRQMAAEGANVFGRFAEHRGHIGALKAHRKGQEQRGEPVTDFFEDMWKWEPQTQRQLAFGVPFVIVNAGMILLGLCSRRPHLMVGRNVQPLLRGSFAATAMFAVDMAYVSMYGGIDSVLTFLPGPVHIGSFFGLCVLAWMPMEQLAACYGSAAAVVTLALTASKVRPLPVFGCALGACGITVTTFGCALIGAFLASWTDPGMVLADVLEVLGHGEGNGAIAEREAAAGRAAQAKLEDATGIQGPFFIGLGRQQRPDLQMQVREHNVNESAAKLARFNSLFVVMSTIISTRLATSNLREALATTTAAAHAAGSCRAAVAARGAGFIAGYGLYKLGLLAGPGENGTSKLGLMGHGEEEQ